MVRTGGLIALAFGLLIAAATHAAPPPAEILATPTQITSFRLEPAQPGEGFRQREGHLALSDPYGEDQLEAEFTLYQTPGDAPAPLVLILTPYRGVTFADSGYAQALARAGMHAAVLAVPRDAYRQDADIGYVDRFFVRHTLNVLALRQALQTHPASPLQVTRVGILGTSLGAIRGSIVFGADPTLDAAVLIMPGGDLPNLIANTVLQPIALWREKFLFPELQDAVFAIAPTPSSAERAAFEAQLRPHVHIDPLDFVRRGSHDQVLLVRSDNDTFVPRHNQDLLFAAYRAAANGQAPYSLEGSGLGHYATVLALYNDERDTIVDFLRQRLLSPASAPRQ